MEKPLSAISGGEVLAALKWHRAGAERLKRQPRETIVEKIEQEKKPFLTESEWGHGVDTLKSGRMAAEKRPRCCCIAIPQWREGEHNAKQAPRARIA